MGMLVQFKLSSTKLKVIFVVTVCQVLRHTTGRALLKCGLEDNLSRAATQIKNGSCGSLIRSANLSKKVVCGDPGVDTLVRAIHDLNPSLFSRDNWEWVDAFQTASNGLQDFLARFRSDHTQTRRSLHRNWRAGLVLIGDIFHGHVHKRVKTPSSAIGVILVGAESRATGFLLGLLENLLFEFGGRTAVVEPVDVNPRACATGIDHERILNQRLRGVVRFGALFGQRRIGGCLSCIYTSVRSSSAHPCGLNTLPVRRLLTEGLDGDR